MSLDHSRNNDRVLRQELGSEEERQQSREWWTTHIDADQLRYRAIAERYADRNAFCRDIASRGRRISKAQARTLMTIEAELRGLTAPRAPSGSKRSRGGLVTRQMTPEELKRMD